jgi:hypothetical protein
MAAASAAEPVIAFRVGLSHFSAIRTDGTTEDDFKTFAQVTILTRGRPNARLWYANDSDVQFAKTSVCRWRGWSRKEEGGGGPPYLHAAPRVGHQWI